MKAKGPVAAVSGAGSPNGCGSSSTPGGGRSPLLNSAASASWAALTSAAEVLGPDCRDDHTANPSTEITTPTVTHRRHGGWTLPACAGCSGRRDRAATAGAGLGQIGGAGIGEVPVLTVDASEPLQPLIGGGLLARGRGDEALVELQTLERIVALVVPVSRHRCRA